MPTADVFSPRKFWTALMSSYMTPYFILTPPNSPKLCQIPEGSFFTKQKKMLCGCTSCLARKGLCPITWEDPDTGISHELAVPYNLVARL